jgi:hypothetical protein
MQEEPSTCPLCDEKLTYYNPLGSYYNFICCPNRVYIPDTGTTHPHYQIQVSSADNSKYQIRYIVDDFIVRNYCIEGISTVSLISKLKDQGVAFRFNYFFNITKNNIKSIIEKLTTIEVFS